MRAVIFKTFLVFSLLLLGFPAWAQANSAGQVIVASGTFTEIKANQTTNKLQRGDYFYSGDTLVTGANTNAQVRFTDGTVVALYPNSRLRVDDYSYQKSSSDKSVVTLVQGGFRALTGLISKSNPDAYKVQTPVAVIGVRGTSYGAVLQGGQLYAGVWKGGIYLKNDKGLIRIGEGEEYNFALVSSRNVAPVGLLNPPRALIGQCGIA